MSSQQQLQPQQQLQQLQQVLKRSDIWQASQRVSKKHSITSGYTALDEILHLGGWPLNRLTEILVERQHIGEMQLVLPTIAKLMKRGGWLFLIEPPFNPYAPGWIKAGLDLQQIVMIKSCQEKDWLWASEQIIANKGVTCCLFWPAKDHLSNKVLKRLQVAAEQGSLLNFIFRSKSVANQSSPASLRMMLKNNKRTNENIRPLGIEILKQTGGWAGQKTVVDLSKNNQKMHPTESFNIEACR